MRWLFIALVVANLSFLGWSWLHQDKAMHRALMESSKSVAYGAQLVTLRELSAPLSLRLYPPVENLGEPLPPDIASGINVGAEDESKATLEPETAESASAITVVTEATVPPQVLHCLRLSGFDSEDAVAVVMSALQQGGATVEKWGEEIRETMRYRVMVPPAPNASAAMHTLERLQRAGVRDFYMIRGGDNRNAISLGVFSSREQADRRVLQIRKTGINPRIEEITVPLKRWWLEFDWADNAGWRELVPATARDNVSDLCH